MAPPMSKPAGALASAADPDMDQDDDTAVDPAADPDMDAPAPQGEQAPPPAGAEAAPAPEGQQVSEDDQNLVKIAVGHCQEALAHVAPDFLRALKADPVQAAVQFGTNALRTVSASAAKAGSPLPLNVMVMAGMVLLQIIAATASEKGFLQESEVEGFLKEGYQQSLKLYVELDGKQGLIKPEDMAAVGQKMGQGKAAPSTGAMNAPAEAEPAAPAAAQPQPKPGA